MRRVWRHTTSTLVAVLLLAACGGGSSNGAASSAASQTVATTTAHDAGAPQATGNTANDGFAWFNFRRQQLGLAAFRRDARIDAAALGHSNYQKINNVITHEQTLGKPGFTGQLVENRLLAAGYMLPQDDYAFGEVISSTSNSSGFNAAEDLIAAIYHRFLIFEPMFKDAGSGAATVASGSTYFTTNFATIGLNSGLKRGTVVIYPFDGQQQVPINFFSDNESPDPVPMKNVNEVGYPISVHANIISTLTVNSFTIRPRNDQPLSVILLTGTSNPSNPNVKVDEHTPHSAAAIIPLARLANGTTYDVSFNGVVDGVPVTHSWSFTTQ